MWERIKETFRSDGVRGILDALRWRLRVASGGRPLLRSLGSAVALLRREGAGAVWNRLRFGVHQFVTPTAVPTPALTEPHHPWTATFAHDAAFNEFFDLSPAELEANRAVTARFDDRAHDVGTATWFLTYFDHALFGGVHTILRLMDYLQTRQGVRHRLVIFDRQGVTDEQVRAAVGEAFPSLRTVDIVLPVSGRIPYEELPHTDISVCTMWISAYAQARFNNTNAKFYLVQDYEPAFYPAGTLSALAEATYRLGFAGLINTPGLDEVYRSYGNPSTHFTPAVDHIFHVGERFDDPNRPVQIVLYGRPGTDRNAFELIASACCRVKDQLGDAVRIVAAGEDWDPAELGLEGQIENLGLLRSLADVADLYQASDIGIAFMLSKHPSYQPFEYLAGGVAPICNVNPATGWLLQDEVNCLIVDPFPSAIASAVTRLVEDAGLRRSIVERGQKQIETVSWDTQFARLWTFLTGDDR